MQEIMQRDGTFIRKFFEARDESELKKQMAEEYKKAMVDDVEEIRQRVLNPDEPCPCGSGRKTKNCCIKRLQRYVSNQEHFAKS